MSKEFTQHLTESSLSKVLRKTEDSRCAILTAFRGEATKQEKRKQNAELAGLLKKKGLSYTQVQGNYVEVDANGKETVVKELSFFVQNTGLPDNEFDKFIFRLGYKYKQDSVLIIPQGGQNAYLWGTSKECDWIEYNKKVKVGNATFGNIKTQFYSKIGGRSFEFRSLTEDVSIELRPQEPQTNNARFLREQALGILLEEVEQIEVEVLTEDVEDSTEE